MYYLEKGGLSILDLGAQTTGKPIGVGFFVAELKKKQQLTRVMKAEYQWLLQKLDPMECKISSDRNGSPSHFY